MQIVCFGIGHLFRDLLAPLALLGVQAKDGGGRRVTLPLESACRAGESLFCHAPTINWQVALVLPQAG